MKASLFDHKKEEGSNQIAKERLKLMVETVPMESSPVAARRMKKRDCGYYIQIL